MSYSFEIVPSCKKDIEKLTKRNSVLKKALENKMSEILQHPQHYKPLQYDLAGEKRVYIMKSFVLKFEIDEERKAVVFLFFGHHDEAYKT